jgi:hypothetical protein
MAETKVTPAEITIPYKFSVYRSAALNSSSSFTVIAFDTKEYDTGTNIDVVTNKGRFTAPVTGFYIFSACAGNAAATNTQMGTQLWKNGSAFKNGNIFDTSLNVGTYQPCTWGPISLTAGDYIEIAFVGGNGSVIGVGASNCWFTGYFVSTT